MWVCAVHGALDKCAQLVPPQKKQKKRELMSWDNCEQSAKIEQITLQSSFLLKWRYSNNVEPLQITNSI